MSECEHEWTNWMGHPSVTDMLARQCRTCREVQMRVLPPDVRAGPGRQDVEALPAREEE